MTNSVRFKLLTAEEVGTIYDECLEFLSTKGIKVDNHPQALKMLGKAGLNSPIDSAEVLRRTQL